MSNSLLRLKQMLLGWGTVGVIYNFSDYLQGEGYQLTPSIIDNLIAFSPSAVWLYLSFFFIVPLGYLSTPLCHLRWLARSMQISALVAGVFYLLWPTTMHYPSFDQMGISAGALNRLIAIDSSQNCFPSLHAALTLLAVWAIAKKGNRNERGLGDSNRLFDSAITQTFIYRFSRRRVAGVDLRLDMRNMREKEDTI